MMKISEFGIRNSELLAIVCLVLIFSTMASAGVVEKKAALGGFDGFVERMGAGTRELGRGNTGSADTSAMPGAYWNPAILGFRQNLNYTLNGEKRDLDRTGGSLGIESSVGKRMGIGFAMLYRGDMDFKVIDDDDQTLGTATPFFSMMYLGFSYRTTRRDAFGISLSMSYDNMDIAEYYEDENIELNDGYTSPVSLNLGWLRQWNEKWSTSVVIRNLSFSKNLSSRWTKTVSSDNSVPSTEGVRPKVLQIGAGYRSKVMGKPVYAFAITLVRQLILYVPLLLILDCVFGFGGMIWAQPITEVIMMAVSVGLLYFIISCEQKKSS